MCEFHESTCNGFGDIWWTDNLIDFSSIDNVICASFPRLQYWLHRGLVMLNEISDNFAFLYNF